MTRRAFTLVEMIVVVAITAMVAGFIVPRVVAMVESQGSRDFESALLRLGADARLLAIETGGTVSVTYDENSGEIIFESINDETQAAEESDTIFVPDSAQLTSFTLRGRQVPITDWVVEFFPDGSGTDAGVEVQDGTRLYAVLITGQDGTAQLVDGALEEDPETEWEAGDLEQRIE